MAQAHLLSGAKVLKKACPPNVGHAFFTLNLFRRKLREAQYFSNDVTSASAGRLARPLSEVSSIMKFT